MILTLRDLICVAIGVGVGIGVWSWTSEGRRIKRKFEKIGRRIRRAIHEVKRRDLENTVLRDENATLKLELEETQRANNRRK
jgi:hypothetical protein